MPLATAANLRSWVRNFNFRPKESIEVFLGFAREAGIATLFKTTITGSGLLLGTKFFDLTDGEQVHHLGYGHYLRVLLDDNKAPGNHPLG